MKHEFYIITNGGCGFGFGDDPPLHDGDGWHITNGGGGDGAITNGGTGS